MAGLGWLAAAGGHGVASGPANGETTGLGEDFAVVVGVVGVVFASAVPAEPSTSALPTVSASVSRTVTARSGWFRASGETGRKENIVGQGTQAS